MVDAGTIHSVQPGGTRLELVVRPDAAQVAQAAASRFVEASRQFIAQDDSFCVALAGGNTPGKLYRLLATSEFRSQVDWGKVQLFWGDERAVPRDHPDSNFGMVQRALLSHVPIPPENIHRMEAEHPEPKTTVRQYEQFLRQYLRLDGRGFPRFHLILLGIGSDGHTASLFPGTQELHETSRWVTTSVSPTLGNRRMTLTLPVLNAAHKVMFLVAGPDKAEILRAVLTKTSHHPLPAQLVTVPEGFRTVLADEAAAALVARKAY